MMDSGYFNNGNFREYSYFAGGNFAFLKRELRWPCYSVQPSYFIQIILNRWHRYTDSLQYYNMQVFKLSVGRKTTTSDQEVLQLRYEK